MACVSRPPLELSSSRRRRASAFTLAINALAPSGVGEDSECDGDGGGGGGGCGTATVEVDVRAAASGAVADGTASGSASGERDAAQALCRPPRPRQIFSFWGEPCRLLIGRQTPPRASRGLDFPTRGTAGSLVLPQTGVTKHHPRRQSMMS